MAVPPDDDVDAWVRQLARAGTNDAEAATLRRVILSHAERQPAVHHDDGAAWERLRFRLRGEGLVRAGRPAWRTWVPAAAVASLAIVCGIAWLGQPAREAMPVSDDAPPALRGGPSAQQVPVADPMRAAQRAAAIAAAHDGRPVVYSRGQEATVDFDLEPEQAAAAEADLKREWPQLSAQAGVNRLVFVRRR